MIKLKVFNLLEENKNPRGIENWKKLNYQNWSSYGIGLTQLKKLAKQVGKNHELALELWKEPNYDIKVISILIEDPKKVNKIQIENMVNGTSMWIMSHIWVQNLFSKVSFAKELSESWRNSNDDVKRRIGYTYLYYLARDKKVLDDYFIPIMNHIKKEIQGEENFVKDAMNNSLLTIGQRSKELNMKCLEVCNSVGKIIVDYGENSCEAVDVVKHLTSERMLKKFK
jgi:3-methyladenine DNA glycosylase AlkD